MIVSHLFVALGLLAAVALVFAGLEEYSARRKNSKEKS